MKWTTANVSLLVTIIVTLTNGANWLIQRNTQFAEIQAMQAKNEAERKLEAAQYQARIDVLINQHDRELRNLYIKMDDINLELERINHKRVLENLKNSKP